MHFVTDTKKLLGFVENILAKKSVLTMSVYLHKQFVRNSRGLFTVSNSDPVQPSDTDLPLYSYVTLADSWSHWLVGFLENSTCLVGFLANSTWTVLKLLTIFGNITISCCT